MLHFVGPCVTIFGSARFDARHPYYELTRTVGRRVSELGFTVMTGGGPGLMEAANRGARDAGGRYSYGFIAMPGGLGTLDELSEALTLIQTGKLEDFPIVLIGTDYWTPLVTMLDHMVDEGAMSRSDLRLVLATDDVSDAMAHLQRHSVRAFGLRPRRPVRARVFLGEHAA